MQDVGHGDATLEIVQAAKGPPAKVQVFGVAEEHDHCVLLLVGSKRIRVNMSRIEGGPRWQYGLHFCFVDVGANQRAQVVSAAIAEPGLHRQIVLGQRDRILWFGAVLPIFPEIDGPDEILQAIERTHNGVDGLGQERNEPVKPGPVVEPYQEPDDRIPGWFAWWWHL